MSSVEIEWCAHRQSVLQFYIFICMKKDRLDRAEKFKRPQKIISSTKWRNSFSTYCPKTTVFGWIVKDTCKGIENIRVDAPNWTYIIELSVLN